MFAFIQPFLRLCLFNANPQDLPASRVLLNVLLILNVLAGLALILPTYGFSIALLETLFELVLLCGFVWIVLQLRSVPERYLQTLNSLLGVSVIMSILVLPLVYSLARLPEGQPPDGLTAFAYLVIFGWAIMVDAHIYRHALSTNMFIGLAVSIAYMVTVMLLVNTVFPQVAPAG